MKSNESSPQKNCSSFTDSYRLYPKRNERQTVCFNQSKLNRLISSFTVTEYTVNCYIEKVFNNVVFYFIIR